MFKVSASLEHCCLHSLTKVLDSNFWAGAQLLGVKICTCCILTENWKIFSSCSSRAVTVSLLQGDPKKRKRAVTVSQLAISYTDL